MRREPGPATIPVLPMERLLYEVKKVIVGQDDLLEKMLVALLARGHMLVEGVPGLAKTMTIKTLSEAIGGIFKRIQFTPDLVPADLIGTRIYDQRNGEFTTWQGPVFANLLLADEINRAPAKVQSALLEVMQERQVTIGHDTFRVPQPFLVLATQNPIETEGTYALPEAQVDRFMLKVIVGYPSPTEEFAIVERMTGLLTPVQEVLSTDDLARHQAEVDRVYADPAIIEYAVRLTRATREPATVGLADLARYVTFGASPRASINLVLTARALAYLRGREYVLPQDVARHGARRHAASARAVVRGPRGGRDERRDPRLDRRAGAGPDGRDAGADPWSHRQRLNGSSTASTGRSSVAWTACSRASTAASSTDPAWTSHPYGNTSPATTCATSTGTSPRGWTRPYVREYVEDREITALVPARPHAVRGLRHRGARPREADRPHRPRRHARTHPHASRQPGRRDRARPRRRGRAAGARRSPAGPATDTGPAVAATPRRSAAHGPRAPLRDGPSRDQAQVGRRHRLRLHLSARLGAGPRACSSVATRSWPIRIDDPREVELPDVGPIILADSETGETLYVDTSDRGLRERFAAAAATREAEIGRAFDRAGVEAVDVSTDEDLVRAIVRMAMLRRRRRR